MKQATYIILIAVFAGLGSCKKFLDVKPEDSVEEEILYSSQAGFQTNLNGIYLALADKDLYGGQLTMEMVDVLAQRYNCISATPTSKYNALAAYDYSALKVQPKITAVWNGLYRLIANVNNLLEKADEHKELFSGINYELIKGEALALRAFLHFDVLRLFGPLYKVDSTTSKRIPYYTSRTTTAGDYLTGLEVINKIVADLKEAEDYLKADPIITNGTSGNSSALFTTARHLRMNYYAVKLLQARVNLYANRKVDALDAAKVVIEKQPAWFRFITSDEVKAPKKPDRIFSSELVFAAQDIDLYSKYEDYFIPTQVDSNFLAPVQTKLDKVYEASENDYRYLAQTWVVPSDGAKSVKCFYKYAPITDTASRKYSIPLMRVTEAYLIAAEASTVTADKFQYLNTVRAARNLTALATTVNFATELTKEYQKEFFGEGQLFYYYKRNNTAKIENGSVTGNIDMNPSTYCLPLPRSETSSRN
ncbi:RagB/SusD family nutrient uptake outer membrane protein [Niastella sp. OAS944]|uniref:RagB/SusD family nutrient uptake outer membrane protein n=1 Tax=Niastella sp. OAS944 TaxID=2664089 RepID=UPI003490C0EF|nr:hypothetical protein [Chitinophagaceae bacterium OAS944]